VWCVFEGAKNAGAIAAPPPTRAQPNEMARRTVARSPGNSTHSSVYGFKVLPLFIGWNST
jgi:hypothetical protein